MTPRDRRKTAAPDESDASAPPRFQVPQIEVADVQGIPILLSTGDVSRLSRLSLQTLALRRLAGKPPSFIKFKGGGRVFYEKSEIERWLASCRRVSTSDPGPNADE